MTHTLGHTSPCDCENCQGPSELVIAGMTNVYPFPRPATAIQIPASDPHEGVMIPALNLDRTRPLNGVLLGVHISQASYFGTRF